MDALPPDVEARVEAEFVTARAAGDIAAAIPVVEAIVREHTGRDMHFVLIENTGKGAFVELPESYVARDQLAKSVGIDPNRMAWTDHGWIVGPDPREEST